LADGTVFDGMELAGRFGDDSLQFVLGKQPAGQFPPAWDVGLVGMCVGERRLLDVPPVLGFGALAVPDEKHPVLPSGQCGRSSGSLKGRAYCLVGRAVTQPSPCI
jgi:hypothetical protein